MAAKSDPLVPLLGSAVAAVVLGALVFVFYPRVSRWIEESEESVAGRAPPRNGSVAVWVCRSVGGVALLIEPFGEPRGERRLDGALHAPAGGRYLRLTIYNFEREPSFAVDLASLTGPDGGPAAIAASRIVRDDASPTARAVLRALGAVERLEVPAGRTGYGLFVLRGEPQAFPRLFLGDLRFERRDVGRLALAAWQKRPAWRTFLDL